MGQTVINSYAEVTGYDTSCNALLVDTGSLFSTGDYVLIIQMKGADIDTTNTSSFGTLNSYNSCGNYEINRVQNVFGNNVSLTYNLAKTYDIPDGKVQLVKVPVFGSYNLAIPHTCMAWNGKKGGVFIMIVNNTLSMYNSIDVSGKGFRGGVNAVSITHGSYVAGQQDYCYPINNFLGAMKGEGVAEVPGSKMYCRGELYNGAGGGNSTNSGGGGGGNGGAGGRGGNEWAAPTSIIGGRGGRSFPYSSTFNRIFFGGGGGAGDLNNSQYTAGGNGGGIIIVVANAIVGNNQSLIANGLNGADCTSGGCNDGFGGGGAGGTILVNAQSVNQLNTTAKGGRGANMNVSQGHGPGGGAGGGAVLVNTPNLFSNITFDVSQGIAGTLNIGNYGAQAGSPGDTTSGYIVPFASSPFVFSGIAGSITDSVSGCMTMTLRATSNSTLNSLNWDFGDGNTGTGNTVTHAYNAPGTYNVKVVMTTPTGCSDSITKFIVVPNKQLNEVITDTVKGCKQTQLYSNSLGTKIVSYKWYLGDGDSSVMNPYTHTYAQYGSYNITLVATDTLGCVDTFSHSVTFTSDFDYSIKDSTIDCVTAIMDTVHNSGQVAHNMLWLFGDGKTANYSPAWHKYDISEDYVVRLVVSDSIGCTDTFAKPIILTKYTIPLTTTGDTTACFSNTLKLSASGASTYTWEPQNALVNNIGATIIANPTASITYYVTGIDTAGCKGYDSVVVIILPLPDIKMSASSQFVSCDSPFVIVNAYGGIRYEWEPAELFEDNTIRSATISPIYNTTVTVKGYDSNGCWNIAKTTISTDKNSKVFVADAFTPNNDGTNDVITPRVVCNLVPDLFIVYSRWGKELYRTSDVSKGWDGTYNGKRQDVGTYHYMITGKKETGQSVVMKGNFILIR